MNILDWIIIIWLGLAFIGGMRSGLVYRLGHLIGLVVGIYLAGNYYTVIAGWIGDSPWNKLVAFQVLLTGISMVSGYVAILLNKIFQFVSWIPLLKSANRLLGGVFGVLANAIILCIVIFFLSRVSINSVLTQTLAESQLANILLLAGNMVAVLLPNDLTSLKQLF